MFFARCTILFFDSVHVVLELEAVFKKNQSLAQQKQTFDFDIWLPSVRNIIKLFKISCEKTNIYL